MTTIQDWKPKSKCLGQEKLFNSVCYGATERIQGTGAAVKIAEAKKMCITCPVRSQCLSSAMLEESYLSGAERHGIRGGLTARERILEAAKDPMCARCRVAPVIVTNEIAKIRRLCSRCQSSTQNDMSARYFPPGSESLEKILGKDLTKV